MIESLLPQLLLVQVLAPLILAQMFTRKLSFFERASMGTANEATVADDRSCLLTSLQLPLNDREREGERMGGVASQKMAPAVGGGSCIAQQRSAFLIGRGVTRLLRSTKQELHHDH